MPLSSSRSERVDAGERFRCPKGVCDQVRPCAFYCWWKPTMAALNHEREQWNR